jgi:hypothetical protein
VTYYQVSQHDVIVKKSTNKRLKNNFKSVSDLVHNGFYRGEKRNGYWGVKHKRALDTMTNLLIERLAPLFKNPYYIEKDYINKPTISSVYDLLLDFHLDKKGIKGHDSIYFNIQETYPPIKYLKSNDYKFLPASLDQYGIKSKYLISKLNEMGSADVNIRTLSYLCRLFGDNYIDYIKKIENWETYCFENPPNKKYHTLKNESEKKSMVELINKWEKETLNEKSFVASINEILTSRDFLEKRNFTDLKFNAKDDYTFEILNKKWTGMKTHLKRGYRTRYAFDEEFLKDVESDIVVDGNVFTVGLLKSEEDFILEGYIMKNCMSKQFMSASFSLYLYILHNKKRINIQYKKGLPVQKYGKANTVVDDLFNKPIEILNKKMLKYPTVHWKKEKFDFI